MVKEYAKSKLEVPTQELIDFTFTDAMFQEAMQVSLLYPVLLTVISRLLLFLSYMVTLQQHFTPA